MYTMRARKGRVTFPDIGQVLCTMSVFRLSLADELTDRHNSLVTSH